MELAMIKILPFLKILRIARFKMFLQRKYTNWNIQFSEQLIKNVDLQMQVYI